MLVAVFTEADGQKYHIGTVKVADDSDISDDLFDGLYEEWLEVIDYQVESSSQFIDWLIDNNKRFSAPAEEVTYVTIET